MWQTLFPIYTKSFGGKISKNLHSVSPGNNFANKFNKVPFEHFSAKKAHYLVQNILNSKLEWNYSKFFKVAPFRNSLIFFHVEYNEKLDPWTDSTSRVKQKFKIL